MLESYCCVVVVIEVGYFKWEIVLFEGVMYDEMLCFDMLFDKMVMFELLMLGGLLMVVVVS